MKSYDAGFGLIEAIVAASIMACACLGLAATVIASVRAESASADRAQLAQVLHNERARLATLPFVVAVAATSPGSSGQPTAPSLLGEVFPWGSAGLDLTAGRYGSDKGVGVFVSERRHGDITVRREARFVRRPADVWVDVPADALGEWTIAQPETLPAAAVQVVIRASAASGASSTLVASFTALPPALDIATP